MKIGFLAISLLVLSVYWISLAASHSADYALNNMTFMDATNLAFSTPYSAVINDGYVHSFLWFIPFCIIITALILFTRSIRTRIIVCGLSAFMSLALTSPAVILLGMVFPLYLLTPSNGETWGEAWPALSAIGFWSLFLLTFIALDLYKHKIWLTRPFVQLREAVASLRI